MHRILKLMCGSLVACVLATVLATSGSMAGAQESSCVGGVYGDAATAKANFGNDCGQAFEETTDFRCDWVPGGWQCSGPGQQPAAPSVDEPPETTPSVPAPDRSSEPDSKATNGGDCVGEVYGDAATAKAKFDDDCGQPFAQTSQFRCDWVPGGWQCSGPGESQSTSTPSPDRVVPTGEYLPGRCTGDLRGALDDAQDSYASSCGVAYSDSSGRHRCNYVRVSNRWSCWGPQGNGGTRGAPLATPADFEVYRGFDGELHFRWTPVAGADGYIVFRENAQVGITRVAGSDGLTIKAGSGEATYKLSAFAFRQRSGMATLVHDSSTTPELSAGRIPITQIVTQSVNKCISDPRCGSSAGDIAKEIDGYMTDAAIPLAEKGRSQFELDLEHSPDWTELGQNEWVGSGEHAGTTINVEPGATGTSFEYTVEGHDAAERPLYQRVEAFVGTHLGRPVVIGWSYYEIYTEFGGGYNDRKRWHGNVPEWVKDLIARFNRDKVNNAQYGDSDGGTKDSNGDWRIDQHGVELNPLTDPDGDGVSVFGDMDNDGDGIADWDDSDDFNKAGSTTTNTNVSDDEGGNTAGQTTTTDTGEGSGRRDCGPGHC